MCLFNYPSKPKLANIEDASHKMHNKIENIVHH